MGCHFLLQGVFLTPGSNQGFLHSRQTLYPLSHQGSPEASGPALASPATLCLSSLQVSVLCEGVPWSLCAVGPRLPSCLGFPDRAGRPPPPPSFAHKPTFTKATKTPAQERTSQVPASLPIPQECPGGWGQTSASRGDLNPQVAVSEAQRSLWCPHLATDLLT